MSRTRRHPQATRPAPHFRRARYWLSTGWQVTVDALAAALFISMPVVLVYLIWAWLD